MKLNTLPTSIKVNSELTASNNRINLKKIIGTPYPSIHTDTDTENSTEKFTKDANDALSKLLRNVSETHSLNVFVSVSVSSVNKAYNYKAANILFQYPIKMHFNH